MSMHEATAPGKIILFGEHAVVYGQPALAAPVQAVRARASVSPGPPGSGLRIQAADLNVSIALAESAVHGLALTAQLVLEITGHAEPDAEIAVSSSIPMASGLGSGAAVSAALARALAAYLGTPLDVAALSALVFEVEKVHHGTPSGIDNTVVCYEQPVYFVRGQPPRTFAAGAPVHLLIGDTGVRSPTRETVGAVRAAWQADPARLDALFANIGQITRRAHEAIAEGRIIEVGQLMDANQALLEQMGVSSPTLERLIMAARAAGAGGAKLSGGGGGGNMIALVAEETLATVRRALLEAGAAQVLYTRVD